MRRAWRRRRVVALLATAVVGFLPQTPATVGSFLSRPPDAAGPVLDRLRPAQAVAPGVTHREFTTTDAAGQVVGDVVEVDLTQPGVRLDALVPGVVAAADAVAAMADGTSAVAGINGDFFDIGRTSAAAGPVVRDGRSVKAAVPQGRRAAPAVPGAEMDYVFAVGADGVARIDRLPLVGEVRGPGGTTPVVGLNQHAVPVGGVAVFTAEWGAADRGRTLCGTDADADAPCATDRWEVVVRDGRVVATGPPGAGRPAPDEIVLDGREQGAAALRSLQVGDRVNVEYSLVPASGVPARAAVGGQPILVDGGPTERLDDRVRAPRSAAGHSSDGRRVLLVTVDGRQDDSIGATLAELSALLDEMGVDDAVNLDGGGSSTLVHREPGADGVTIVNDPSGSSARRVGNGIGVYSG